MAGTPAARLPWGFAGLLLVVWTPTATAATGSLEVEMAGNTQTAFLNDNVTIICKIPGSPLLDIKIIGITWFRKSPKSGMEVKLFECFGKHRTVFRPGASVSPVRLKTGDASLQLPDVQLWETGEYRCEVVVTPQKAKGRVWLHVLAHPTSALFPEKSVVKGNEDNHTVESERTHVWWIPSLIIIGLIILVSSCVWKRACCVPLLYILPAPTLLFLLALGCHLLLPVPGPCTSLANQTLSSLTYVFWTHTGCCWRDRRCVAS